jgi:hypothetical protein
VPVVQMLHLRSGADQIAGTLSNHAFPSENGVSDRIDSK